MRDVIGLRRICNIRQYGLGVKVALKDCFDFGMQFIQLRDDYSDPGLAVLLQSFDRPSCSGFEFLCDICRLESLGRTGLIG